MRPALRAEWTKLCTSPGTPWLLAGVVAATVAVSAVVALAGAACAGCVPDSARLALAGVQLGQAVVAVLAVSVIGTEHATGMMGTTLAAMPRRERVFGAKAAVLAVALVPPAVAAVVGGLAVGRFAAAGTWASPASGAVLRAAAGSVLYLVLVALLAFGVAAAVRQPAVATGVVLGLLFVLPVLVLAIADEDRQRQLRRLIPTAGLAVQATRDLDALPIGPWAGLGVLAAWTAVALAAGAAVFLRRDA